MRERSVRQRNARLAGAVVLMLLAGCAAIRGPAVPQTPVQVTVSVDVALTTAYREVGLLVKAGSVKATDGKRVVSILDGAAALNDQGTAYAQAGNTSAALTAVGLAVQALGEAQRIIAEWQGGGA